MPKATQKKCSKGLLSIAAIGGLVVGAAAAHTFFMCPEASYPACYQQMVKDGFSRLEGVQYTHNASWDDNSLSLELASDVTCPYWAKVSVRVPSIDADGNPTLPEVFGEVVRFENGDAPIVKTESLDVAPGTEITVLIHSLPTENYGRDGVTELPKTEDSFDIFSIVGSTVMMHNKVLRLKKPE